MKGGYNGKMLFVNLTSGEIREEELTDEVATNFIGGYGSLLIEPIILPRFPVHVSFPILAGVGGIAYSYEEWEFRDSFVEDSDFFLVIEPGVELEFNILKHFRIAVGAYYTLTSEIQLEYAETFPGVDARIAPPNVIRGINMGVTMKFGRF